MLVKNPITSFLYTCGYNGIDNIYDFWGENKTNIINKYFKTQAKSAIKDDLVSFEYKVRWGSGFGMFVRLGIDKAIRTNQHKNLGLNDIKVRYGKKYFGIHEFSEETISYDSDYTDLRGISILKKTFDEVTISNVDFSYATLDACDFISVNFENCCFFKTSFRDTRLRHCLFNDKCMLEDNDFTQAFINSEFNCNLVNPKMNYRKFYSLKSRRKHNEQKYLNYTVIVNPSFYNLME